MREPSEMVIASRMQNIVQIRKNNTYFVPRTLVRFVVFTFRALGIESHHGGAITASNACIKYDLSTVTFPIVRTTHDLSTVTFSIIILVCELSTFPIVCITFDLSTVTLSIVRIMYDLSSAQKNHRRVSA